jgi:hypothetical protein
VSNLKFLISCKISRSVDDFVLQSNGSDIEEITEFDECQAVMMDNSIAPIVDVRSYPGLDLMTAANPARTGHRSGSRKKSPFRLETSVFHVQLRMEQRAVVRYERYQAR